jgi:peptidoglycan/xylan/chitin deacetylase (PgdA/CDA1 family)
LTGGVTEEQRRIARRTFLGVAAAGALAACAANPDGGATVSTEPAGTTGTAGDMASASAAPASTSTPATSGAAGQSTAATTTSGSTPSTAAAGGAAAFVPNGPRTKQQVSLTFHANGDVGLAGRLLDIVRERSVHVTIFGVGSWMEANPKLVARMVADGHEVANHTWSHPTMGPLGRTVIADEIRRCAEVLTKLTGSISPWFRPSGIEVPTPLILDEAGRVGYRTSVGYDVDSLDFQDPGAKAVVANVAATVQPGSIVSVHFGHQNTVDAMPALLDLLASRGLAPVTVGTLLG